AAATAGSTTCSLERVISVRLCPPRGACGSTPCRSRASGEVTTSDSWRSSTSPPDEPPAGSQAVRPPTAPDDWISARRVRGFDDDRTREPANGGERAWGTGHWRDSA